MNGLAARLVAPFVPTVEWEAMDLQDPTLRLLNLELLEFAGNMESRLWVLRE
jgi:hypothetical protein